MPELINFFFPDTFLILAATHFLALLSPGPDFFMIAGHAIRGGFKGSAAICAGIASGHGVYIFLALLGWSGLKESELLFQIVGITGAVFIILMGVGLARKAKIMIQISETDFLSFKAQLGMGFITSLLNPKNAVFYLTMFTTIVGPNVNGTQQLSVAIWMFMVVLGWDLLIAWSFSHPVFQARLSRRIYTIEKGAGVCLVLIGSGVLVYDILGIVRLSSVWALFR